MHLMGSAGSPFVRKPRLVAAAKGLTLDLVVTEGGQPKAGPLRNANPLKKVPCLVLDDGTQLFDSHVICEYLDSLSDTPRVFAAPGPARWLALRNAALADGLMEAAILALYEKRYRPEEKWVQSWVDMQLGKTNSALAWLDGNLPAPGVDYGVITVATAVAFVDNRIGKGWRDTNRNLSAWFDSTTATLPGWDATKPPA